jgi:predicted ATP-binding protein involved in virulence
MLLNKIKDSQKRTYASFFYKTSEPERGQEFERLTINVFYLSSAEHQIVSEEIAESTSPSNVKTTLDLSLFQEIRKRNELVTQISLNQNGDLPSLQEQNSLLIKILNSFFKDTKKRLDEDTTVFNVLTPQGEKISCYDLSTGEKQLLLIFLTAFNSNKRPCIMLMDEPDLGIHIDWKKKLISSIRELNPNAQLILSTHSPSMIEGWFDNVKEMDEITTNA